MKTKTNSIKTDRRAVRSKRLIIEAFRELILEKEYRSITVSDIVKRADIGRATFYAHFEDKDHLGRFLFGQLLTQIESEIQVILEESSGNNSDHQQIVPSLALFRIAEEKYRWFKLNATNPEIGLVMLVKPLVERFLTQIETLDITLNEDDLPREITANFLISALIALLTNWIVDEMPISPEAMDSIYQSLAQPTLSRFLKR